MIKRQIHSLEAAYKKQVQNLVGKPLEKLHVNKTRLQSYRTVTSGNGNSAAIKGVKESGWVCILCILFWINN